MSPDPETAYLSDNAPVAPPNPNRLAFSPVKPEDGSALGLLARLRLNPQNSDTALAQLRALPDVGENRYWLGVALQELKKNAEAEQLLRLQQGRAGLAPIYHQWVDLRLAELATARGANKEARALLEKIRGANDREDFKQRWDLAKLKDQVIDSKRRRRIVYEALAKGQHRSWDYQPIRDAGTAYMRNNVVLDDLEARTRLPRVS